VTKNLETVVDELNLEELLLEFHKYLCEFSSDISEDNGVDIGVKTIKTIINELVKIKGEAIWSAYSVITMHGQPDELMKKYLIF